MQFTMVLHYSVMLHVCTHFKYMEFGKLYGCAKLIIFLINITNNRSFLSILLIKSDNLSVPKSQKTTSGIYRPNGVFWIHSSIHMSCDQQIRVPFHPFCNIFKHKLYKSTHGQDGAEFFKLIQFCTFSGRKIFCRLFFELENFLFSTPIFYSQSKKQHFVRHRLFYAIFPTSSSF